MPRQCCGTDGGTPCTFSKVGGPTQPKHGQTRCVWCDPQNLEKACATKGGRARPGQLLRGMPEAAREQALRRLPEEIHEEYFAAEFGAQLKDPDAFAAEGSVLSTDSDEDEQMALPPEAAEVEFDASELHHSSGHLEQGKDEHDLNAVEHESEAGDHEIPMFEPEPFEDRMEEAGSERAQEEPTPGFAANRADRQ